MAGVNDDDAQRVFLSGHYQVADGAAPAHAGFGRVVAEEDRKLAVHQVADVVTGFFVAIGVLHGVGDLGCAVGVVQIQPAAQNVHQTVYLVPAGYHPAQVSGAVDAKNRFIAIGFYYAAQLGGDGVQGPVPGNALKATLSALTDPLEGMQKALF